MPKAYVKKKNFLSRKKMPRYNEAILQFSFRYSARVSISLIFDPI